MQAMLKKSDETYKQVANIARATERLQSQVNDMEERQAAEYGDDH